MKSGKEPRSVTAACSATAAMPATRTRSRACSRPGEAVTSGTNGSTRKLATQAAAALRRVVPDRPEQSAQGRDSLTGLLDGRALHEALAATIADAEHRGEDVGLLFLDLDYFKRINDQHGHQAGSRILRQVATLLESAAGDAGGFAARYGGDEFVLVLPCIDLDQAVRRAERLRTHLASTIFSSGPGAGSRPEVRLTCSVGAAGLRHLPAASPRAASEEDVAARLLRKADDAMYAAKRAGRNRVVATGAEATGAA